MPAIAEDGGAPPLTVRRALVRAFRSIIRLYFREIERVGEPPSADTRGRVFVSNHHNALIDPILVLTDAACEISPIAKSTLWSIPGLRWLLDRAGAVPIVRRKDAPDKDASQNAEMFAKIAAHLAGGGNVLIFPEGTSHSEPHLAPLRTGAARMLVAAAERGGVPPTFQAVALEFDARDDFRSRCLVLWGPVRRLDELGSDGDGEREVRAITARMDADLRELLVEGDSHDARRLVARVAEMLANDAGDASLSGWSTIGRQVEAAAALLRDADPSVVAHVAARIDAYYAELARFGLGDAQLAVPRAAAHKPRSRWIRRAALAPLAAPGIALYAIPYFIPRMIARRADPDAVSTVKLGTALLVYPLWAAGLVALSFVLIPPPLSLAAAAVVVASPFAALRWLDAYWNRAPGHHATGDDLARLARLRIAARTAIDDARARL
ncbi:MAG TPA: 1-acyl-sn-glycerol-3-phosphate acyltransferase [Kofleriaceae bacterium]|nr:1-acyl-sn-glycerol-3-phosphate acyltransferase [Kofleriaceae bacterium]